MRKNTYVAIAEIIFLVIAFYLLVIAKTYIPIAILSGSAILHYGLSKTRRNFYTTLAEIIPVVISLYLLVTMRMYIPTGLLLTLGILEFGLSQK